VRGEEIEGSGVRGEGSVSRPDIGCHLFCVKARGDMMTPRVVWRYSENFKREVVRELEEGFEGAEFLEDVVQVGEGEVGEFLLLAFAMGVEFFGDVAECGCPSREEGL